MYNKYKNELSTMTSENSLVTKTRSHISGVSLEYEECCLWNKMNFTEGGEREVGQEFQKNKVEEPLLSTTTYSEM